MKVLRFIKYMSKTRCRPSVSKSFKNHNLNIRRETEKESSRLYNKDLLLHGDPKFAQIQFNAYLRFHL